MKIAVKRQMVNQSQGNQGTTQVQHTQSPQQSQSPQQQAKTQILQQFTPSIQLQSTGGTGQQQYGNCPYFRHNFLLKNDLFCHLMVNFEILTLNHQMSSI